MSTGEENKVISVTTLFHSDLEEECYQFIKVDRKL